MERGLGDLATSTVGSGARGGIGAQACLAAGALAVAARRRGIAPCRGAGGAL
jgi:hypothetical protein